MKGYEYSENIWNYVLPDGSAFCHWGGRGISYRVLELLNLRERDRLCDICCGEAGTLTLIDLPVSEIYGIDVSSRALEMASKNLRSKNPHLRQADIREMPFEDGYFDKLFAQDPDVFLCPDKQRIVDEIFRITRSGGRFVLQTYCATSYLGQEDRQKMSDALKNIGYPYTDVVSVGELERLVGRSGFVIQLSQDLYDIYSQDSLRMIENLEINWEVVKQSDEQQAHNLRELLYLGRELFLRKAWTGILLSVEKL